MKRLALAAAFLLTGFAVWADRTVTSLATSVQVNVATLTRQEEAAALSRPPPSFSSPTAVPGSRHPMKRR